MNLFETASRAAFRFPSNKGELSVEQLWQLPLSSRGGFDLDSVAKGVNAALAEASETSFVQSTSPAKAILEQKLEIVKYIIQVKLKEKEEAKVKSQNNTIKQQLLEALEQKETTELMSKSAEEIRKMLADLE